MPDTTTPTELAKIIFWQECLKQWLALENYRDYRLKAKLTAEKVVAWLLALEELAKVGFPSSALFGG
jgi:hypothetical protein